MWEHEGRDPGATEKPQLLLGRPQEAEQEGNKCPGFSPLSAPESSARASHWPNLLGSLRAREPQNCDALCGHGANLYLTSARTRPSTDLLPWRNRVTEAFSNLMKLSSVPVTGYRFLVFILDSLRMASSL